MEDLVFEGFEAMEMGPIPVIKNILEEFHGANCGANGGRR